MTGKLAIFTPQLGAASETFIRRHVQDLMPGRTVVVVRTASTHFDGYWQAQCPVLFLDRWALRAPVRIAGRLGISREYLRDITVARFLRKHGVTAILGEYLDQFLDFVPLLNRMKLRYIVQGLGIDVSATLRTPGMAKKYLSYRSAAAVLTRSEFHRSRLIQIGLPPDKVQVNLAGVDVPERVPERSAAARKRFLAVGRFVPKKGPIYLLESFRLAAARDLAITLEYLGGGQLLSAAQQFVSACGLENRVRLYGPVKSEVVSELSRTCGVFVQHSLTDPETGDEEGLPTAIQEAMAVGMVVISTRHSGIPEAVEHEESGLLVDERDVAGMAELMVRAANDPALYERLGTCAYKKAKGLYSWPMERSRLLAYLGAAARQDTAK